MFSYQQLLTQWSSLMEEIEDKIEEVAVELVSKIRRLHFQEGTSSTARTRQIKEIIEFNSKKINLDAS
jgi:hypothetical protein